MSMNKQNGSLESVRVVLFRTTDKSDTTTKKTVCSDHVTRSWQPRKTTYHWINVSKARGQTLTERLHPASPVWISEIDHQSLSGCPVWDSSQIGQSAPGGARWRLERSPGSRGMDWMERAPGRIVLWEPAGTCAGLQNALPAKGRWSAYTTRFVMYSVLWLYILLGCLELFSVVLML